LLRDDSSLLFFYLLVLYMFNKLLELLEKVWNFITKAWQKMVDWKFIFHELIVVKGVIEANQAINPVEVMLFFN